MPTGIGRSEWMVDKEDGNITLLLRNQTMSYTSNKALHSVATQSLKM